MSRILKLIFGLNQYKSENILQYKVSQTTGVMWRRLCNVFNMLLI